MKLFSVGEETDHRVGDVACAGCAEGYPVRCRCGGLIHSAQGEEDSDGTEWAATACDRCHGIEDR